MDVFNGKSAAEWYSLYSQAIVTHQSEQSTVEVNRIHLRSDRYWLFAGECFYARGGMHDFCGEYESIELAKQQAFYEWWHVWDTVDQKCVAASERQPFNAPRYPPKGKE